ncbi:3-phosphoserine/phosphohydroxythreonine transaminase [Solimicrobium silvestre]|uniref:Phosphoserine aminotransferase n=1 Tax=Solimicrobium silvestre TaxID=2099400 RepID=A0A2S9GZ39_9BURK|nr:3-phosphoserine/phosphohydroxythreonine transaminase [Solimicrobium silvestre]PRC93002.1 Phosphoserine transaminase [Solimicrobium silvestre]
MIYNFSAGPAVLPKEVLQQAAAEMLDWHGSGMSVMEMSHRGTEFMSILANAQQDLRELLAVPSNYKILFMQGGAIAENAIVPLNLAGLGNRAQPATLDYICTGSWSVKSIKEAAKYGTVNVAADARTFSPDGKFSSIPAPSNWQLSSDAAYLHICTNETIDGVEYGFTPNVSMPIVADMSSHILSRVISVSDYGVIYGGAQKNIGPAGLTIVIVREDLLGYALPACPSAFNWKTVADNDSMFNTPPTYAIYIAGLVFQWIKRQGGVAALEKINVAKAALLYDYLDNSRLYENRIVKDCRSRMNVPFFLRDESLNAIFLSEAKARGLLQLKGHSSVGGMRASIYNAMPIEGVQALVAFMDEFERQYFK